jgi:metal-responsive CopG/Arc/MetJ family transcriptional regulator
MRLSATLEVLPKYNLSQPTAMKRTIHLPDELAQQIEEYLNQHPEENWSSIAQKALKQVICRKNPSSLLAVAGSMELPADASTNEDEYH